MANDNRSPLSASRTAPMRRPPNTGDVSARAGHIYCDKAPGQSLLAAPVYALFMHGEREPDAARLNDAAYVITLASVALPGALAVWVLHTLLLAFGARAAWAVAVALGYGLATMAWPYSTMLFGHQLVAALLLFAFALLQRDDARAMTRVACAGLCLGLACMVEYQAVLGALAGYMGGKVNDALEWFYNIFTSIPYILLVLTFAVSTITLASGRATVLHGTVHLVVFAAFLFLSVVP